jgi:cobalt-zinc-cadmium efflux system outer membrane protein
MYRKHVWIGLLMLAGCYGRVRPEVDSLICASANRQVDYLPATPAIKSVPVMQSADLPKLPASKILPPAEAAAPEDNASVKVGNTVFDNLLLTSAQESKVGAQPKKLTTLETRLRVPSAVPGADVAPFQLPSPKKDPEAFKAAVNKYFPPLPPIGAEQEPRPGPDGRPLTLSDLQELARSNSPLLRQAAADVAAAKGAAIQAGAYPNPTLGVQSATASNTGGPSYGIFWAQTIKTMGKLKLAQAAAIMDVENAQIAYQRAETDLMAAVRAGYFAVLVAQENIKASRALVNLTDEVYKVNVEQVGGGEAAPYEPMQVAVFAAQARQSLLIARNSYTLAWKQLVTKLGVQGMPPIALAGRVDMPLPRYEYDKVLAHVLIYHTEVITAVTGVHKARYNLRLAEVAAVPDVSVQTTLTNDNSLGVNNRLVAGVQASVPVPVWDRNLGAIHQAQGALNRAIEEEHRVRLDLTSRVADAFRRYDESRDLLELYRTDILPKQVQAFRAAVTRHYGGALGRVAYTDLITSEQNLVSVIGPYIIALGAQWQAVVDVANLLQTEDLFQSHGVFPVAPVPDLDRLLQLPCCHPCSPLPGSVVVGASQAWPAAGFGSVSTEPSMPKTLPPMEKELGIPGHQANPTPSTSQIDATPRLGAARLVEADLTSLKENRP